jgi:uncharacterized protein with von Willebrand factor type A (vWA) domain
MEEYYEHFKKNVAPQIASSKASVVIMSEGEDIDPTQATELGMLVMLNKQIVLLLQPGSTPSEKLIKIADAIVYDFDPASTDASDRIVEAISSLGGDE